MAAKVGTLRSAWRHRAWRPFVSATAVSGTGDHLYSVALLVYLVQTTNSAGWIAAAAIGRMAVYTALGPVGGVIADRVDRRRLMVGLDLARAATMAVVGLIVIADGPPALVLGAALVASGLATPYRPAMVAVTTLLVPEDDLAAANAAEASINQLAWFAGPAIGAALVALSSPSTAFFVNGATFAVSALLVARIGDVGKGSVTAGDGDDEPSPGAFAQFTEGVRAVRHVPGLAALTLLLVSVLFAYGVEQVVTVLVVRDRLGLPADRIGVLSACLGAGGLLAVPLVARLAARRDAGRMLAIAGVLMGLPLALLAVTDNLIVAGGLMVVEGVGNIALDVLAITLLQRACPEALLGRVYSLQDTGGSLAQLLGSVAAPVIVSFATLEAALWVGGGSLVLASLALLGSLQAISRRTNAERERLAPVVAQLAATGVLGDASAAALERIARATTTTRFAHGATVFEEGDSADDLYVVLSGEVRVATIAQGEIRDLAAGDWFGEIGLLRQLPRTATITAVTDIELLVVPGEVFVGAITAQDGLPMSLRSAIELRLGTTHPHLLATTD